MDALMYPRSAKASQIVGGSGRRNRLAANTFRNQAISQINGNGGVQPGLPATWQFLGTASSYPTFLIPPVTASKSWHKTKTTDTKPFNGNVQIPRINARSNAETIPQP